jgi:hypothetical protein
MTYTLNQAGGIVRDSDGAFIPQDDANSDYQAYLLWVSQGNSATPYSPPQPTPQELQRLLTDTVQSLMDSKAQAYHYDNLTTAVTYAEEPSVPKFQEEGQAFRSWRSTVWATAYSILAEVQAGTRSFPTVSEVPSLLPPFPLDAPLD